MGLGGEQPFYTQNRTVFHGGFFNFFTLVVIYSRRSWSVVIALEKRSSSPSKWRQGLFS